MDNSSIHLRRSAIGYLVAGIGFLALGFPFWFLGAKDESLKGKMILPFLFLRDDLFPLDLYFWHGPVAITAMFIGAFSLWQAGEPTGFGTRRNFLYVPMAVAVAYFLGQWMPLPFAPFGAFLSGLGMILVGVASIKAASIIGFWGFPWMALGLAAWQRAKKIRIVSIA